MEGGHARSATQQSFSTVGQAVTEGLSSVSQPATLTAPAGLTPSPNYCVCQDQATSSSGQTTSTPGQPRVGQPQPNPPLPQPSSGPGPVSRSMAFTLSEIMAARRQQQSQAQRAPGRAAVEVDEYSTNPTQAFTFYNINQGRFQPPHVHM